MLRPGRGLPGWGKLRRLALLSIDLLFVASATVIAVMLRGSFETVSNALIISVPYIFISVGCTCAVFLLAGLDRTPWRFSSVADHLQVVVLTVLAILIALGLTFAMDRLEHVARSLPVVQGALSISILICARSAARFWYARQIHLNGINRGNGQPHDTVLVVGLNTVTELFLLSVKEFASERVQVAGILSEEPDMRGRTIQQKPVLGTVEELQDILQSLEVHGVIVDRIVVATAADRLQPRALATLLEIEKSWSIVVQFLSERLGFDDSSLRPSVLSGQARVPDQRAAARFGSVIDLEHADSAGKFFRFAKRIVDIFGATLLVFTLTPVAALVAFIVALDVGFPVIFWQQRPGLYGRPFKLYKFRTMRAPHDELRRRIPDDQRSSAVGQLLRRTRLDELPQLFNVLIGDMSLIGPRPLLPCDQSPDYAARLFVRPGISGWAQVNGGRIISPSDKLILDIWYVQNASWVLDVAIVFRTVKMILFGDRINIKAVNEARSGLGPKALLRTTMVPAE
jgi:lipopolysaccharide/colanic/teichoic acid biosynthesis glycosyltransferase